MAQISTMAAAREPVSVLEWLPCSWPVARKGIEPRVLVPLCVLCFFAGYGCL
jgi:hypothetical protein